MRDTRERLGFRGCAAAVLASAALATTLAACSGGGDTDASGDAATTPELPDDPLPVLVYSERDDGPVASEAYQWDDVVRLAATDFAVFGLRKDGTVRVAVAESSEDSDTVVSPPPEPDTKAEDDDALREAVGTLSDVREIDGNAGRFVALLGDGTATSFCKGRYDPYDVSDWQDVRSIAVGNVFAVGTCGDGHVLVAGHNEGTSPELFQLVPDLSGWKDIVQVTAEEDTVAGLRRDGTVVAQRQDGGRRTDVAMPALTGAKEIAAMRGCVAALMPDGSVRVSSMDDPCACIPAFGTDEWQGVHELSASSSMLGAGILVGTCEDGRVMYGSQKGSKVPDISRWSSMRQVVQCRSCLVGLCASDDLAREFRATQAKASESPRESHPMFVEYDYTAMPSEDDIRAYNELHRNGDWWVSSWFATRLPEGYEVAPSLKAQAAAGVDHGLRKIVKEGGEDENGEIRDAPLITIEQPLHEVPRGTEKMTFDGTYAAKSGIEYQVFRAEGTDDRASEPVHTYARFLAWDGDASYTITGRDVDDDTMLSFLDGFRPNDDWPEQDAR